MGIVNFMAKMLKMVGVVLANYTIWVINHASGLRLTKKANYLANQVFVIVPPGFDALAYTDSFSAKTLKVN
jgi:hypothetical protein